MNQAEKDIRDAAGAAILYFALFLSSLFISRRVGRVIRVSAGEP